MKEQGIMKEQEKNILMSAQDLNEKQIYLNLGGKVVGLLKALHEKKSKFCDDEDVVRECVKYEPQSLAYASERLRDKKDVVLIAVNKNGVALEFASLRLRNDPKVVKSAVTGNGRSRALAYIGSELQLNKEILELVIKESPKIMQRVDEALLDKEWLVEIMSQCNGRVFKYLPEKIRFDKDFVLKVIKQEVYDSLDCSLKSDEDVLWAAMNANPGDFLHVPEQLRSEERIAKKMLAIDGNSYYNLSFELRSKPEILEYALRHCKEQNSCSISERIPKELKTKEVALKCVGINGLELQYYWDFYDDEEVVRAAVSNDSLAIEFASMRLKENKELSLLALSNDAEALLYLSEKMRSDYLIGHKALTNGGGWLLECLSENLRSDFELVKIAVKKDGSSIAFASKELKDNEEIALLALKSDPSALTFLSDRLKKGVRKGRQAIEQKMEQTMEQTNIFKAANNKRSNYDCLSWFVSSESARKCKELLEKESIGDGAPLMSARKMRL